MIWYILLIAACTAIVFCIGVITGIGWTRKSCKLRTYTLAIERFNADFQESSYESKRFASQQDREEFIDRHTTEMLAQGYQYDVGVNRLVKNHDYYIVYHEID